MQSRNPRPPARQAKALVNSLPLHPGTWPYAPCISGTTGTLTVMCSVSLRSRLQKGYLSSVAGSTKQAHSLSGFFFGGGGGKGKGVASHLEGNVN